MALERCLLLTTQLMELQSKMCLALNMSDEAKKEGIEIDSALLGEILGVECVSVSAFYGENLETLLDRLIHIANEPLEPNKRVYADFLENEISKVEDFLKQKHYEDIERVEGSNPFAPTTS